MSGVPHSSWANWVSAQLPPRHSVPPLGGSLADARENVAKSSGSQGQSKDGAQWHGQPGDASDGCLVVVVECAAGVVSEGSKVDS